GKLQLRGARRDPRRGGPDCFLAIDRPPAGRTTRRAGGSRSRLCDRAAALPSRSGHLSERPRRRDYRPQPAPAGCGPRGPRAGHTGRADPRLRRWLQRSGHHGLPVISSRKKNMSNQTQDPSPALARNPRRRKALISVAIVVGAVGLAWGGYEWVVARHYESTDNAYVQGNVIQVTPQISGTVMAIYADDTDFVKAGQPLVKLDPADAKVALDQAEANLGQTVRQVRTLYTNNGSLAAQVALKESDIAKAQSEIG